MAAKGESTSAVDQITASIEELSLGLTVLSWNINGPGKADARKRLVPSVVSHIDPDVMLLQETKSGITPYVVDRKSGSSRTYNIEKAENEEEAQVLYDSKTFEKVDPSKVDIDKILTEMFPANETMELRGDNRVPVRAVIKKRICAVHLRHKLTKREIVFVSYHNIRKGGGKGAVKDKASQFCQVISKIRQSSKCSVIAGADLNCNDFSRAYARVLDYSATPRRHGKAKVDFFIFDKSTVGGAVEAFYFLPKTKDEPFHDRLQDLLAVHKEEDYDKAIDHDPLKLSLQISRPQKPERSSSPSDPLPLKVVTEQ